MSPIFFSPVALSSILETHTVSRTRTWFRQLTKPNKAVRQLHGGRQAPSRDRRCRLIFLFCLCSRQTAWLFFFIFLRRRIPSEYDVLSRLENRQMDSRYYARTLSLNALDGYYQENADMHWRSCGRSTTIEGLRDGSKSKTHWSSPPAVLVKCSAWWWSSTTSLVSFQTGILNNSKASEPSVYCYNHSLVMKRVCAITAVCHSRGYWVLGRHTR